jgi:hypothetical protein
MTCDPATPGIPTVYRDVQFRSRLEARWAAFFDRVGWGWRYEPFDLSGWIPDFVLLGKEPILVEVKPVITLPADVTAKLDRACPFVSDAPGWMDYGYGAYDKDLYILLLGCSMAGWLRLSGVLSGG